MRPGPLVRGGRARSLNSPEWGGAPVGPVPLLGEQTFQAPRPQKGKRALSLWNDTLK
jgi:hypothetical protein